MPKDRRFEMRFEPAMLARIDAWRFAHKDALDRVPSIAEAIRQMCDAELGRWEKKQRLVEKS